MQPTDDKRKPNMYDLAIIGSGAAGIASARHALKYGLKTILFDRNRADFGGTCLNRGCIPTKFFLNSSKLGKTWQESFSKKNDIIEKIKKDSFNYLEKAGVKICFADISFIDEHTLMAGKEKIEAKNIIIASGSKPKALLRHPKCIFAEELFSISNLDDNFLIVGAGYIGIEFSSLLNRLKKKVTLIEKQENILPVFDSAIVGRLKIILEKYGIKIETSADLKNYDLESYDRVILAVGRTPDTGGLDIEKTGLFFDKGGWIKTDNKMQTNIENIYACGDVTGGRLLAYVAEAEAQVCIENIMGRKESMNYRGIADCVFSIPQIARVGIQETEAKEKNLKYKILRTNFLKFSSSYVYDDQDGFMQVLVGEKDTIMGASIISNYAAELINIFSYAICNNLDINSFRKCFFIHPTISEIIPAHLRAAA
ncbi:MAG: NAD(P)/FAD-dependent oxidoreductase [Candidatus Omnitrophica bacterium]|nr:NAD(P)/FAD-dependent oxidoreductase [Candidatus Omnitrophota bacterium]